jgi:Ca-activated chloride channel family protein
LGTGLVAVDGRTYPLTGVSVVARAEAGVALTTLTQRFDNPYDEALEVIYALPLPADGSVLGYAIRIGEKVIRGEIQRREQAEARYREALYEGRVAGLLEQDRADTFQQRIGNIPPRTSVEVEIEVMQPLAFLTAVGGSAPQWEYRFPTVTGVRYQGQPGRVPDSERLDADRDIEGGIPTRFELTLTIADVAERAGAASSPSHAIDVSTDPAGARVSLRQRERLDRDVAVRWNACASEVGVTLVTGGGMSGDDGRYGLVTVVPPAAPASTFARDLTVLIDASGSMTGIPLECAKEIARALIGSLESNDRFEIIAFANEPRRLTVDLEPVSERTIEQAFARLDALEAAGGTEMGKGIEEALRPLREESQRQVVLLSDGQIGFEQEMVGLLARLPNGCRLHAAAIGRVPNRTLTRAVARAGRGVEIVVDRVADAAEAAQRLIAASSRPVLTDVVVSGTALKALAPVRPGDVFAGCPLRLTAELESEGGTLEIEGRLAGASEPWRRRVEVPPVGAEHAVSTPLPIGALHGREAIADLEQELARGDRAEALLRIESRGLRHRITSLRTSLVAIAEEPSVDPKQPRRREKLAVELPADVVADGLGLAGSRLNWGGAPALIVGRRRPDVLMSLDSHAPPALVGSSLASRLKRRLRLAQAGEDLPLAPATIVRREDELLVLELESPLEGFELPDEVEVLWDGKPSGKAKVDRDESSPAGPHERGLRVRLALRFDWRRTWEPDHMLILRWTGRLGSAEGSPMFVIVEPEATT